MHLFLKPAVGLCGLNKLVEFWLLTQVFWIQTWVGLWTCDFDPGFQSYIYASFVITLESETFVRVLYIHHALSLHLSLGELKYFGTTVVGYSFSLHDKTFRFLFVVDSAFEEYNIGVVEWSFFCGEGTVSWSLTCLGPWCRYKLVIWRIFPGLYVLLS